MHYPSLSWCCASGSLSICSDIPNEYGIGSRQGDYTYHWFIGGVNKGTGPTYTVAAGSILVPTTIGLQGVTSAGCSTTLVESTITVSTPLTLSLDTNLTGDVLCPSESFTLTVQDAQSSNTTYTLTYGSQIERINSSTGSATSASDFALGFSKKTPSASWKPISSSVCHGLFML